MENAAETSGSGPEVGSDVVPQLQIIMSAGAREVMDRLGRTEDLRFSPDGERLAILGFHSNMCGLFSLALDRSAPLPVLYMDGGLELRSATMKSPHGVDFLDDDKVVVASRGGKVDIFRLPAASVSGPGSALTPLRLITRASPFQSLGMPGSVWVTRRNDLAAQLLVCDNIKHSISSHTVIAGATCVLPGRVLLQQRLQIPDGVTVSPDGRWMAVSNHASHEIFFYDRSRRLGPDSEPHGIARGGDYPHGLRFSPDGSSLYVADAGQPFVLRFSAPEGDWAGDRRESGKIRVMDEETFLMGRYNPQEGGPKGLELDPGGEVLLVTSDYQRLAAFHIPTVFT